MDQGTQSQLNQSMGGKAWASKAPSAQRRMSSARRAGAGLGGGPMSTLSEGGVKERNFSLAGNMLAQQSTCAAAHTNPKYDEYDV